MASTESNPFFYFPATAGKTAVTLVMHGLNTRPAAMMPLVHWLNQQGSDVFLVSLSGHHPQGVPLKEVDAGTWQQEVKLAYAAAKEAASANGLPLYFLGYSMGALLAQTALTLPMQTAPFQKQVLLAPALSLRRRAGLLRLLCLFTKQLSLPSYTPKAYKANDSLPLSVYRILFAEEKKLQAAGFQHLNIPTLVIMDPKDELISCRGLQTLMNRLQLSQYRLLLLNDDLHGRSHRFHHLIVDEATMGNQNWETATQEMKTFLF
jgi:esterase/lipase